MRKVFMMVVASVVLMGTTVSTKAASLLNISGVSIKNNDENLVLKHANQLFGKSELSSTGHTSHASHESHASHSSHYSSR